MATSLEAKAIEKGNWEGWTEWMNSGLEKWVGGTETEKHEHCRMVKGESKKLLVS